MVSLLCVVSGRCIRSSSAGEGVSVSARWVSQSGVDCVDAITGEGDGGDWEVGGWRDMLYDETVRGLFQGEERWRVAQLTGCVSMHEGIA